MKVSDRTYFMLKRLHSLTGVVPIGLFLLEHFFTNSRALQGAGAFDQAAADLARHPLRRRSSRRSASGCPSCSTWCWA